MSQSPSNNKKDLGFTGDALISGLASLVSNNSICLITNAVGDIFYVSKNLKDIIGSTVDELYGKSFDSIFELKPYEIIPENSIEKSSVYCLMLPDQRWFLCQRLIVQNIGIIYNVILPSEQRFSSNSEVLRLEKLELAIENAQLAIWEWNHKTNEVLWSPELGKALNVDVSDTSGFYQKLLKNIHPEDRELVKNKISEAIQTRSLFEAEHRILNPDGSYTWILGRGKVLIDSAGDVIGMVGVSMNISDRKIAEQELIDSEERFRLTAVQTGQLLYDYHVESGEIFWNGAIENITGFTPEDFANVDIEGWENMVHPEDRQTVLDSLEDAFSNDKDFSIVYRFLHKKGHYFYVFDKGTLLLENGKIKRLLGSMRDLSEQVLAEEKIKNSEDRYRELFTNLKIGIMVQDTDSKILFINKVATDIFGLPVNYFKGQKSLNNSTWKSYDEKGHEYPAEQRPLTKVLKTGIAIENHLIGLEIPPLPVKWILFSHHPQKDSEGNVSEVISTFLDVTQQKKTEEALKNISLGLSATAGKDFFNKIVEFMSSTLEVDYTLVCSLAGDNTRFKTLSASFNNKIVENFECDLKDTPCEQVYKSEFCYYPDRVIELFPKNEMLKDLEINSYMGTSLLNSEGEVIGVLMVMSKNAIKEPDIATYILKAFATRAASEIQRLKDEDEKNALIEILIEQNKELQDFSYVLSHTVRSPVATLLGLTSIFDKTTPENPFNTELVDKIELVATNLDRVIKDLVESLALRNTSELYEKVVLEDVVKKIYRQYEARMEDKNVILDYDFSKAPYISSIYKYLYNILSSLIENSIQYSSQYRQLHIEISSDILKEFLTIQIKDNGIGFDSDLHKDHIFSMYKKFHKHSEGKGLGLFLVKNQINALHGKIEINSKEDQGTQVTIFLPLNSLQ